MQSNSLTSDNWKPLEHKHRWWNSIYHGTAYSDGKGWYIDKYEWKRRQSELKAIIEEGTSDPRPKQRKRKV